MAIDNSAATALTASDAILDGPHINGPGAAERTLLSVSALFAEGAWWHGLGHGRAAAGFPAFIRSRRLRPLRFTVVCDDRTRIVLRTIMGRSLHAVTALDEFDRA